jgi:hypothetical protein
VARLPLAAPLTKQFASSFEKHYNVPLNQAQLSLNFSPAALPPAQMKLYPFLSHHSSIIFLHQALLFYFPPLPSSSKRSSKTLVSKERKERSNKFSEGKRVIHIKTICEDLRLLSEIFFLSALRSDETGLGRADGGSFESFNGKR